ncbi:MAG: outer membrane protein assembly factor BamC, partial [Limnohabitans sp.]
MKSLNRLVVAPSLLTLALAGCTSLDEEKINYKSARTASTLDVPPDLTQLRRDSRYNLESTSATASGFQAAASRVSDAGTAANAMGDVRMERNGTQRWLVVNRPADKIWEPLKEFWISNGFVLTTDAPELGIMETDWAENRAKLPQDFLRRSLGKLFDNLYSTGERDRFRTRIERNAQGGVDIYISHRGMQEVYTSSNKDNTTWQARPADIELEIEFLRRLMVKLGGKPELVAATGSAANAPGATVGGAAPSASVTLQGGQPVISLNDDLERSWRRLGVALDRTGFTVEDRDRRQGIYFVRYVASTDPGQEPGFLSRM